VSLLSLHFVIPRPTIPSLCPYTTPFRSRLLRRHHDDPEGHGQEPGEERPGSDLQRDPLRPERAARAVRRGRLLRAVRHHHVRLRSEEHTSELQSRENLVCRLLLEKRKID